MTSYEILLKLQKTFGTGKEKDPSLQFSPRLGQISDPSDLNQARPLVWTNKGKTSVLDH